MYCSILITGILFLWYCDQNGTEHTWLPCICNLESPSSDTVIRMEQYIPDTHAGVSGMFCSILITLSPEKDSNLHMQGCQVCTVPFWSQYHKKRIPSYICRGVGYVLYLTTLYMYVGILFLWYCDQNGTVHTLHPWICKLESPSCDTVIRMEQYIPDSTAYVSWNPLLVILWSEWNSCTVPFWSQYHKKRIPTYICRGVRYVLFHSDHSITRRGF
jgi:hypothetical protein